MTKSICLISFAALSALALFEHSPGWPSASVRLALALAFSLTLTALVRREVESLLER